MLLLLAYLVIGIIVGRVQFGRLEGDHEDRACGAVVSAVLWPPILFYLLIVYGQE